MRRNKLIVLVLGIVVSTFVYVGWCWRTFMISPESPDLTALVIELPATAMDEIRTAGLLEPEPFTCSRAIQLLSMPCNSVPPRLRFENHIAFYVRVTRGGEQEVWLQSSGLRMTPGWLHHQSGDEAALEKNPTEQAARKNRSSTSNLNSKSHVGGSEN